MTKNYYEFHLQKIISLIDLLVCLINMFMYVRIKSLTQFI